MSNYDSDNSRSNILLKVSASVAAYKAVYLASELVKNGHQVQVVGTPQSKNFVGASTWEGITQNPYLDDIYSTGGAHQHIHLDRWADLILLAPATANTLNKMSSGIGDNLVTNLFLAHDFNKPYIVVPAMNEKMLIHPSTQFSVQKLKQWGLIFVEPQDGPLACGEKGLGRMSEPEYVLTVVQHELHKRISSKGKRLNVLVTGGGTRESIDDVRVLTNTSTGKTSAQIADYCYTQGHDVTLLTAESATRPKSPIKIKTFNDYTSLEKSLLSEIQEVKYDIVFHAAAVSDYSLRIPHMGKLNSSQDKLIIELEKNEKIVDKIKKQSSNPNLKLVAFKLTSSSCPEVQRTAITNLFAHSSTDWIVHNDYKEINIGKPCYTLYKNQVQNSLGAFSKPKDFAKAILDEVNL